MNRASSFPNRSTAINFQFLAAIMALAIFALALLEVGVTFRVTSGDPAPRQIVSTAAISAAPQAVPVPTPSHSKRQQVVPQMSATPASAGFQPIAQPVATPPVGK